MHRGQTVGWAGQLENVGKLARQANVPPALVNKGVAEPTLWELARVGGPWQDVPISFCRILQKSISGFLYIDSNPLAKDIYGPLQSFSNEVVDANNSANSSFPAMRPLPFITGPISDSCLVAVPERCSWQKWLLKSTVEKSWMSSILMSLTVVSFLSSYHWVLPLLLFCSLGTYKRNNVPVSVAQGKRCSASGHVPRDLALPRSDTATAQLARRNSVGTPNLESPPRRLLKMSNYVTPFFLYTTLS